MLAANGGLYHHLHIQSFSSNESNFHFFIFEEKGEVEPQRDIKTEREPRDFHQLKSDSFIRPGSFLWTI